MKSSPFFVTLLFAVVVPAAAQEARKPRLFVTDSDSWQFSATVAGGGDGIAASAAGGARPQTAEILKTVLEKCPDVVPTRDPERADYVLQLEHEGGKSIVRRDNKYVLFDDNGDAVAGGSTRLLGNAVKDACQALGRDWAARL